MSCCSWSWASLPIRTGRASSYPVRWSSVDSLEVDPVVDRVQHLERRAVADLIGDEVEEAVRLVVEAERVQAPQRERRVAHPAVPVVPVPFPAGRLGERGRGRGQQRAGGRVRQALQRERAALQDAAPRMIGERSVVQPPAPEVRGPTHARGRVLVRQRRLVVRPRQRDEVAIAFLHLADRQRRSSLQPQAHAGRQPEGGVVRASASDRLAVPRARVLPLGVGAPVVEHGLAVHLHVDGAVDAAELPQQARVRRRRRSADADTSVAVDRRSTAPRSARPAPPANRCSYATWSPGCSSRGCSVAPPARTAPPAPAGTCRRSDPGSLRRRWERRAWARTTTRCCRSER